jgi:hypothetical protein
MPLLKLRITSSESLFIYQYNLAARYVSNAAMISLMDLGFVSFSFSSTSHFAKITQPSHFVSDNEIRVALLITIF